MSNHMVVRINGEDHWVEDGAIVVWDGCDTTEYPLDRSKPFTIEVRTPTKAEIEAWEEEEEGKPTAETILKDKLHWYWQWYISGSDSRGFQEWYKGLNQSDKIMYVDEFDRQKRLTEEKNES